MPGRAIVRPGAYASATLGSGICDALMGRSRINDLFEAVVYRTDHTPTPSRYALDAGLCVIIRFRRRVEWQPDEMSYLQGWVQSLRDWLARDDVCPTLFALLTGWGYAPAVPGSGICDAATQRSRWIVIGRWVDAHTQC